MDNHAYPDTTPWSNLTFKRDFVIDKLAVVFPRTTSEVEVIRAANVFKVPVIPVGGLTGLMGGAMPLTDCTIIDMKEMNRVLYASREERLVKCEAGITIEELDNVLFNEGLMVGHDPWTKNMQLWEDV